WENAFFGVNSAIVRITSEAPLLTPDALAPWSRVQAKIAASNTGDSHVHLFMEILCSSMIITGWGIVI
ncbi:hypothetical protein, partial [Waltera sp.]|uniref:hypothetical protein n=1 Tax=Waltera sp. TaxID=2815806 RepID=UPI003AB33454